MLYLYLNWLGYISCAWPMFDCWWICWIFSHFSLLWHFFCMSHTCVSSGFILALKDDLVRWGNITIFQEPHPWNNWLTYILRFQSLWYYDLASEWSLPVFQNSTSQEKKAVLSLSLEKKWGIILDIGKQSNILRSVLLLPKYY